ncbi:hypothetical protein [Mycolicibacterium chlorophenolicum]|uniref:Uncharacterized protein n=1 Tax=Mycolicibacterium chlorophenolicum TaxID=37916 RepID=A0A0J6WKE5_9MYCO|nr:hypothetical protein [Mycolicibacterium chlorophenolicum]KMO83810.1 hypothetical protein MCHLDSM_00270 [Mycolicibacterium chlorophenolicum]
MDMDIDDEPPRRPIEANLAQALAWGAPLWILDKDGPPPQEPRGESRCAPILARIRSWIYRRRR